MADKGLRPVRHKDCCRASNQNVEPSEPANAVMSQPKHFCHHAMTPPGCANGSRTLSFSTASAASEAASGALAVG